MDEEATILINGDGTYADASGAALEVLRVTLEELRELPPNALSVENDRQQAEDLRAAMAMTGSDRLIGTGTVQRPHGGRVRVRFLITPASEGRHLAALKVIDEPVDEPSAVFTMSQVLSAWRAAERRLDELTVESPEWASVQAQIASFRGQYQRLFDRGLRRPAREPGD